MAGSAHSVVEMPAGEGGGPLLLPYASTLLSMGTGVSTKQSTEHRKQKRESRQPQRQDWQGQQQQKQQEQQQKEQQEQQQQQQQQQERPKQQQRRQQHDLACPESDLIIMQPLGLFLLRGLDDAKLIHQATPLALKVGLV